MIQKHILLTLFFCLLLSSLFSQGYNIGIRAGIGQTKFLGPSEVNATENYSLSGGFHFGINFQWNFSEVIGIRSEIVYNQSGSKYTFESDDAYYLYRRLVTNTFALDLSPREEWPFLRDYSKISLTHRKSYLK